MCVNEVVGKRREGKKPEMIRKMIKMHVDFVEMFVSIFSGNPERMKQMSVTG